MEVGLLIIGSEVLDGKITDLNTRFLAEFLKKNHLSLRETISVRDDETSIKTALEKLSQTCEVIVTSGGLGPTLDDITKKTLATFLNRTVSYSQDAHQVAEGNYQRFERTFPGKEHGYAFLPEGFVALSNSTGFAPGLFAQHMNIYIFSAPGVPREFRSMLEDHFMQLLSGKLSSDRFLDTVTIRTKKIPEEKIFSEVDSQLWSKLSAYGEVSSLPKIMGVDICMNIKASSREELEQKKEAVHKIFDESPVCQHIWQRGTKELEEAIVEFANKNKITIGFAESCTGGLCSHRITNVSGSSQSFLGSVVSYDSAVKESLLFVEKKTLSTHGAVSLETAREMAQGLAKALRVKVAVSITGLAGPTGGTPEKPVGTVCIGTCVNGKVTANTYRFHGDREQLKNRFAQAALYTLLEEMEKISPPRPA